MKRDGRGGTEVSVKITCEKKKDGLKMALMWPLCRRRNLDLRDREEKRKERRKRRGRRSRRKSRRGRSDRGRADLRLIIWYNRGTMPTVRAVELTLS